MNHNVDARPPSLDNTISKDGGYAALPLWEHQKKTIELAKVLTGLGLFYEVGTGKTRSACEIIEWHFREMRRRVLIFAPPAVLSNWKREFQKYTGIEEEVVEILSGSGDKRKKLIFERIDRDWFDGSYIFITNYETANMKKVWPTLSALTFDVLICDESHKLKNPSAKRTKQIIKLADNVIYKYLLSGTPILNTPMDLYSQYRVMLGGFPLGTRLISKFAEFKEEFFIDLNAGMPANVHFPDWELKPSSLSRINKVVSETSVCIKKKDCLDLPPLIRTIREVEMSDLQKRAYKEMHKDFITYVNGKEVVAQLALTKALRLMQIVSGFVKAEDGSIIKFEKTERLEVLKELLYELSPNHKIIVWATFKENYNDIKKICNDLELNYAELHGGIPTEDKGEEIDRFNTNHLCRVMIANQLSGGVGVNLIASDYSIYYSRDFSLEGDVQSEARNYRAGSEIHPCITRIDLCCKDTIDEIVLKRLEDKSFTSEQILTELKGISRSH